eukprot:2985923-Pyramimonas_sp.AAC.1
MVARLAPRVVALLVRQKPVVPLRDCQAASKDWQTCVCQVSAHVQACSGRSSSCSSSIPNGSLPCRTTFNAWDFYHVREIAC